MKTANEIAAKKLVSIYTNSSAGSKERYLAIEALGLNGHEIAAEKLVNIYSNSSAGSKERYLVITALGNVGGQGFKKTSEIID